MSDTRTDGGRAGTAVEPDAAPQAAWEAFRRVADASPAYRGILASAGVDPATERDWSALPVLSRRSIFARGVAGWLVHGPITDAVEIVCSSGQSGPPFALGLSGAGAAERMRERVDGLLTALGAGPGSPSLLVNALPMGISVPTSLATCATPSVHIEMALHLLTSVAPAFDRVLLVAEPLFLAELARRWAAAGSVHPETWIVTGGEPVAEAWRAYVCGLLGLDPHRVTISMGAAELGLHLLHEVPELVLARSRAAADPAGAAEGTWGDLCDGTYVPALLTFDPSRLHLETRRDASGTPRLLVTTLEDVPLPLIRYDLGDVAMTLDRRAAASLASHTGVPLPAPLVALAGRGAHLRTATGARVRPESVRERLFGDARLADDLTGRFRLRVAEPGRVLECHLEARGRGAPGPEVEAALRGLEEWLWTRGGVVTRVVRHPAGRYPYHPEGDWTHKPRYLDPEGGAA